MSLRVDVVSIFPAYLDALRLSLPGKAIRDGLLDLHVHDLRDWTHDRHRTVDDVPYGGGAGMVMRPEPWGEALDALVPGTPSDSVLVVPTPSGRLFTQALAHDLATAHHLVVACGRYEGIDQRVLDHAATRMRVVEVSIGDYVLNGGEAAALVILEATVRLLPGFLGNPDSLTEESHDPATGLLEYPVYTRPESWRGLDVPAVLRGGDHAAIAAWRHAQALRRTADRRPDLAHPARAVTADDLPRLVKAATPADAGEILTLQRACWLSEQQDNPGVPIPALHESLEEVRDWLTEWTTLVVRVEGRLVAAGRARRQGTTWDIGRLMVAPDLQGTGLGRAMLAALEEAAPDDVTGYTLFTGEGRLRNQRIYRRAGYRPWPDPDGEPGTVRLSKRPSKRRR